MKPKLSIKERLEAYHLKNNVYVVGVLIVITVISVAIYMIPSFRENDVVANISLAVFTSLLASIVAISAELYVQFKSCEKDEFLQDIHTFGIENLNKNKEEALRELLKECDKEIWISGYRLIMTEALKEDIAKVIVEHGVRVKLLACPPWEQAYELVYGNDKVMDNYFKLFHELCKAEKEYGQEKLVEIRFVRKPIFSDTYKIDQKLISGPYMHNKDSDNNKITAKDFFSYNLVKKSPLYDLIESEFLALWDEAETILDTREFENIYELYVKQDYNEKEKKELLRGILVSTNEKDTF